MSCFTFLVYKNIYFYEQIKLSHIPQGAGCEFEHLFGSSAVS